MRDLRSWKEFLDRSKDECDLTKIIIRKDDGHAKASKINAYGYLECSAKWNDGVLDVFKMAAKAILEKEKKNKCCLLF